MKSYASFEIWIEPAEKQPANPKAPPYTVRVTDSPAGPAAGTLSLNLANKKFKTEINRVMGEDNNLEPRRALGERLFGALFQGKVRDAWVETRGRVAAGQAAGVRLRLWVSDPALAALPWELLWEAGRGFIATEANLALSRYLPVPEPAYHSYESPLRVLLAVASPSPPLPAVPAAEIQALQDTLQSLAPAVEFEVLESATLSGIQQKLQKNFHIFHFLGHGLPGKLALVGTAAAPVEFVDDQSFAQLFSGRTSLRAVLLTACSSSQVRDGSPFSGMGPVLVQKRLPAVIAMQYPAVQADTAGKFARAFYQALGSGLPVDVAVNEGRQQISAGPLLGTRDWSTPVLYMGTRNGDVLDLIRPETSPEERAWSSITSALKNSEADSLARLTGRFQEIAALQHSLAGWMDLGERLNDLADAYAPGEAVVEKAGGDPLRLNSGRLKSIWKTVSREHLPAMEAFLTAHPEMAVPAGLQDLGKIAGDIDAAFNQVALGKLLDSAGAFGRRLGEAQSLSHDQHRQALKRLLSLTNATLGRFVES